MKSKFSFLLLVPSLLFCGCDFTPTPAPSSKVLDHLDIYEAKTSYMVGDEFVKPKVLVYYVNDTQAYNATSLSKFDGYNMEKSGTYTVNVSYTENSKTVSNSYSIIVNNLPAPAKPVSLSVTNPITTYSLNGTFIPPNVIVTYDNEQKKSVNAIFTGFDLTKIGEQTVKVAYTEGDTTVETSYKITVTKDAPIDPLDVKDINPELVNSAEYLEFWNHSSTISLDISMSRAAAEFMDTYQSGRMGTEYYDYYVPCTFSLTVNDKLTNYEDVGIRMKGNTSRNKCLVDGDFSAYSLCHYKFKFGETFDGEEYDDIPALNEFKKTYASDKERKAIKKRTLFDMEKLNIKWNRNDDVTLSKQGFILKTFENNGVLAGKSTLGTTYLSIKNSKKISATYEFLEDIDEVFITRHFSEENATGDLYKCAYQNAPANFNKNYKVGREIGVEDNVKNYHPAYDLKTNKKKSDHSALTNLLEVMNQNKLSAIEFKEKISKVMDMKSFMMYEAIAFLGGNFDDLRNNANNYYLYFVPSTNYCYIIPYDFDRCFGCGTDGFQDHMTNFSADSTKMQCSRSMQTMSIYWRTVCRKTTNYPDRVDEYYSMYCTNIRNLLENAITPTIFEAFVNEYPSSYRGKPTGSGGGNISFSSYIQAKKNAIITNNPEIGI